ncbi:hypothetical protein EhV087 [Emiliania huxleyi virus 86]|uniref:Uncharacterized protein n=1 Tax=Emiliania huxleyi virus 86 (isolate United Kingdom/English Channel/1999) TaxID=654925 RepID=Q4A346_EHV8U|nr:hypothetical protein EhV087 [Emiliania huxleyi virus 86]CAI65510.1 hypothetical protein EhV087 [Emiliania huxleyi virus 86]
MSTSQDIKTQLFTYTDPDTKETKVRFVYGFAIPPNALNDAPTLISSEGRIIHKKTKVLITRGSTQKCLKPYLETARTDGGAPLMQTRIAHTFLNQTINPYMEDIDHLDRVRTNNAIYNLLPRIKNPHRADKSSEKMAIKQNINIPIQVTFKTGKYENETRIYSSIKEASYDTDITISRGYIAELVHKHETIYSNFVVKRIDTEIQGEQWLPAQVFTKTNELVDISNFLCSNNGRFIEKRIGYAYFPRPNVSQVYAKVAGHLAHRITLSTFSPATFFRGAHCLHNDDDKTQCSVECLRWGTHKENMADRIGIPSPKNPDSTNIPLIATNITTNEVLLFDNGAVEAADYFKVASTRISAAKYGQKLFNEWTFQNNMDHDRTRYLPGELWLYDKTCMGDAAAERRKNNKRKRPDHHPPPQPKKNAATGHAQAEAIWSYVVNTRNDRPSEFSDETWTKHNGHIEAATVLDITRQNIGKAVNRATPTPNKSGTLYYYFVNGEHDVPERQPNKKPAHPRKGTTLWSIEVSHKRDTIPEFDPTRWKMHISKPAAAEALHITAKAVEGATNRSTPTPNADKSIYYYIVNANNDIVKPFVESVVDMEVS